MARVVADGSEHELIFLGKNAGELSAVTPASCGFRVTQYLTVDKAMEAVVAAEEAGALPRAIVVKLGTEADGSDSGLELIARVRRLEGGAAVFCVVWSYTATMSMDTRFACFAPKVSANMVGGARNDMKSLLTVLREIAARGTTGPYSCPHCHLPAMTEDEVWEHVPRYHTAISKPAGSCPICGKHQRNLATHLRHSHGPWGRGEGTPRSSAATIHPFALVVVRRKSDGRFLVVHEPASWGYWLPGGAVDEMETLQDGAIRECMEEAGVAVRLTGVLRMSYTPLDPHHTRLRAVFLAEPIDDDAPAKSIPDFESNGAAWVTLEEVCGPDAKMNLRGPEPAYWFDYVARGGPAAPMFIVNHSEGSPAPDAEAAAAVVRVAAGVTPADGATKAGAGGAGGADGTVGAE